MIIFYNNKIYIKTISIKYLMSDIKIFDTKPFYITLVEPGKINHLDWNNPDYVQTLISMPFITTHEVEPSKFFEKIHQLLKIDETNNHLMNEYIAEEPDYIYEMMYINTLNIESDLPFNEFASLLHLEKEVVRGNAIIIKSYIPSLSNDMSFTDMKNSDLFKIIRDRGFTKIVVYDEKLREEEIYGDIEVFAKNFFEEESYKKEEFAFLKHNINIYYTKSEYGEENICGKLLDGKIDKFMIFTMLTDTIRGNITLNEVNKIIKLSNKLEPPYLPEEKWTKEEKDEYGRIIIKNRFRILDNIYLNVYNE